MGNSHANGAGNPKTGKAGRDEPAAVVGRLGEPNGFNKHDFGMAKNGRACITSVADFTDEQKKLLQDSW